MDPKLILPGLLLIGGAVFYLQPKPPSELPASASAPASRPDTSLLRLGMIETQAPRYDGSNPEVLRRKELAGLHYASPAILRQAEGIGIVSDLIDGIGPENAQAMPAALQAIAAPADCAYVKPRPGDQVASVHLYSGGEPSNAHLYSDRTVVRAALNGLLYHKDRRGVEITDNASIVEMPETTALRQVDVMVNLPGAPVFLVLQDRAGGVLWNIQPTPGTSVSQVTVLAGGWSGVVNLPPDAGLQGENLAAETSCSRGMHPVEPPPADSQPRAGYSVNRLEARTHGLRGYDPYSAWFTTTFGFEPATNAVWAARAHHVLLGAMPTADAPKLAYRSAAGSTLHVVPAPLTYVVPPAEHENRLRNRAVQMLAAVYGVAPDADLGALVRAATAERIQ